MDRRTLFSMIGRAAGASVMYDAMTSLGFAAESRYTGPIKLHGDPKGSSVLILGAGVAGMTAALELRNAGYQVQVLEYNDRVGGRNWTLRGGDQFHRTRRCHAEVRVRPGLVFESWSTGVFPITTALSWTIAGGSASRSNRSSRSITTRTSIRANISTASRGAFAKSRRTFMATSPNCSPKPPRRAGWIKPSPNKMRRCCSKRCGSGARSTTLIRIGKVCAAVSDAVTRSRRAAAWPALRLPPSPSNCASC